VPEAASQVGPTALLAAERRAFVLRKLHSLTGVVPVGVFLVLHLWTNAKALSGERAFDAAVRDIARLPYLGAIEVAAIALPLSFHALYGIVLVLEGRPNVGRYAYSRNWMYTMQRVSGIVAFAFICWHLSEFRIPKLFGKTSVDAFYPTLSAHLSSTTLGVPFVALVYLVGVFACVVHFANGLWGFCVSWGITVSRRSQRIAASVFAVVGAVLFILGADTVVYFATGARFFASSHDASTAADCGSAP
jgi:succinate dehydrogenase / fumarate reductase cytochrome b subunit